MKHSSVYELFAWVGIALLSTLGIVVGLILVDFPSFIAKLLIVTIALVVVVSLCLDRSWYKALGFSLGFTPLLLFLFTPLGETMALAIITLLS